MTRRWAATGAFGLVVTIGVGAYLTDRPDGSDQVAARSPATRVNANAPSTPNPARAGARRHEPASVRVAPAEAGRITSQAPMRATSTADSEPQRAPGLTPPAADPPTASQVASPTATVATASSTPTPLLTAPVDTPQSSAATKPKTGDLTVKVAKDSVIGIRIDQTLTTQTARVDDKVTARVARDVMVEDRTAIPANARLEGTVTVVERAGRLPDRWRVGIRFHTLVLANDKRVAIQTETIFRDTELAGEPSAALGASAALGVMLSNRGRAAPGSNARAQALAASDRTDARIPAGSLLTVKLIAPIVVEIQKLTTHD